MINWIANIKLIILNTKNNLTLIYKKIAKNRYTSVFTNYKIAFFKKFKKNII